MAKKKKVDFVVMRFTLPMCVAKHIRNEAYDYQQNNGGNLKETWPIIAKWSSEHNDEVKKELIGAGILPG